MSFSLDEMNTALGEFLTELGRVEFAMLLVMDLYNEAPLEHLFAIYSSKTFGPKIDCFKAWCTPASVAETNRPVLEQVYKNLEGLLPQRNYIVHGETWEGAFGGNPKQPYRIGVTKDNLEYLDDLARGKYGPNVFDVPKVRAAADLCGTIRNDLEILKKSGGES